ncbi:MAG: hypothetical protein QY309_13265 [Cyclobacteriaceae bacterium]|nr:MAG: hypothetical protein QY309_13265 [Cyclobacteriaceae bacterium]
MQYYQTQSKWNDFFEYVKNELYNIDKQSIGFLHEQSDNEQNIFIATNDKKAIEILSRKFKLKSCNNPFNLLDKKDWAFTGNKDLFGQPI